MIVPDMADMAEYESSDFLRSMDILSFSHGYDAITE